MRTLAGGGLVQFCQLSVQMAHHCAELITPSRGRISALKTVDICLDSIPGVFAEGAGDELIIIKGGTLPDTEAVRISNCGWIGLRICGKGVHVHVKGYIYRPEAKIMRETCASGIPTAVQCLRDSVA